MRARELIKKYPAEYASLKASIADDMRVQFMPLNSEFSARQRAILIKKFDVISFNAVFIFLSFYHERQRGLKLSANNAKRGSGASTVGPNCRLI